MKKITQDQIDSLALEIFEEFKGQTECVTMQEAQEMAKMELNAKNISRYEKSDKPRKKTTRERKIDQDKAYILDLLIKGYTGIQPCMVRVKNETEFSFTFNENSYTVKLIKHRPQK